MIRHAYVLCGGKSQRFGSDKARAPHDRHRMQESQPQLVCLSEQLGRDGFRVEPIADRVDRFADLGIECLADRWPDAGPLGGLATALWHCQQQRSRLANLSPWVWLVNCDQWVWDSTWFSQLSTPIGAGHLASVFHSSGWHPMPGLYHAELLSMVERRLGSAGGIRKQFSLQGLLEELALNDRLVQVETSVPPSRFAFNTPEELARIQREAP